MFKKMLSLIDTIGERYKKTFADRIESFNDPLAKEIEWGSIARVHYGFVNRTLLKTKNDSIRFVPSIKVVLFDMGFIIMGGYVMWEFSLLRPPIDAIVFYPISTILSYFYFLPELLSSNKVWGHLFGFVFLLIGLLGLFYSLRPIVFNTANRLYSKGFWRSEKVAFDSIHAIQIISTSGGEPGHRTYELNLVLKNKTRMHVFGHSKKKTIIKDATELSKMLSVPVWDMA